MNAFVPPCGACGHPLLACQCQTSAMQIAPPIVPPVLPSPPRIKWGGYLICTACRMADAYCACARQPSPPPTPDGAESSLNARIRALKGTP